MEMKYYVVTKYFKEYKTDVYEFNDLKETFNFYENKLLQNFGKPTETVIIGAPDIYDTEEVSLIFPEHFYYGETFNIKKINLKEKIQILLKEINKIQPTFKKDLEKKYGSNYIRYMKKIEELIDKANKVVKILEEYARKHVITLCWRIKDFESALEKLKRKPQYKDVTKLGDLIALRVNVLDERRYLSMVNKIKSKVGSSLKITDISDYINSPRVDYSGVFQMNIENSIELQIRHPIQNLIYETTHDTLYKQHDERYSNISPEEKQQAMQDASKFASWVKDGGTNNLELKSRLFKKLLLKTLKKIFQQNYLSNVFDNSSKKTILIFFKRKYKRLGNFGNEIAKVLRL